jgi:hypothetical protein
MNINKLSQDEIDQLDFDGDLTATEFDDMNVHGNFATQLPGGATALCVKTSLPDTHFYVYSAGSVGPTGAAVGGGGGYQSPGVQIYGGGGGGSNSYQAVGAVSFPF